MNLANDALQALRSVTCEAQYRGVGAFAARTATVTAKVSLAKLPAGDSLVARISAGRSYG